MMFELSLRCFLSQNSSLVNILCIRISLSSSEPMSEDEFLRKYHPITALLNLMKTQPKVDQVCVYKWHGMLCPRSIVSYDRDIWACHTYLGMSHDAYEGIMSMSLASSSHIYLILTRIRHSDPATEPVPVFLFDAVSSLYLLVSNNLVFFLKQACTTTKYSMLHAEIVKVFKDIVRSLLHISILYNLHDAFVSTCTIPKVLFTLPLTTFSRSVFSAWARAFSLLLHLSSQCIERAIIRGVLDLGLRF